MVKRIGQRCQEHAQDAARCFVYHLSSSFPLVVFIRFIIPYCQGFFRVNFAENVLVLHFLDGLQISWRRWAQKKAATGRSFLQFIILDDGGAGGEVGFFFVKKSEFLLAFCVVSACAQKHGFAGTFVAIWKAFDEKKIGLAAVPLILQEVICLDEGAFVFLWIVVKNEGIGIEEGFEIAHEADAAFDFAEIPALVSVGV